MTLSPPARSRRQTDCPIYLSSFSVTIRRGQSHGRAMRRLAKRRLPVPCSREGIGRRKTNSLSLPITRADCADVDLTCCRITRIPGSIRNRTQCGTCMRFLLESSGGIARIPALQYRAAIIIHEILHLPVQTSSYMLRREEQSPTVMKPLLCGLRTSATIPRRSANAGRLLSHEILLPQFISARAQVYGNPPMVPLRCASLMPATLLANRPRPQQPSPVFRFDGSQAVYSRRSSLNPFCARRSFKPVEWR